ncbi:MAG: alpha-amylase family glycosyl hydrolase [Candidatus Enteromonas sp.]
MEERYLKFLDLNFYQIYPKSFKDANNDGIGDFLGIKEKVPYLASLGIKGVWLSPCFASPNVDSGYDISDYRMVGKEFGTMEEFKDMLDTFHSYGIKVIVDLVVNHCSTEHIWFKEALKGKENPYHDYFYWFDEIPNDWNSVFGGSAYEYVPTLGQYYLHSFAKEQADLNWENPKVREEVKGIVDFWVNLGIDGFRCDVLDMVSKDFKEGKNGDGPRLHEFLKEIFDRPHMKDMYLVGECWNTPTSKVKALTGEDRGELVTAFVAGDLAHATPRFEKVNVIDYDQIHRHFARKMELYQENDLIFAPFFENHDLTRTISKFGNDRELRYECATFYATILYTLRGTPFCLQGQEFGTMDAFYPTIDSFDDVESKNFYARNHGVMDEEELMDLINYDSRDNGRRPMVWDDSPTGGFNDGHKPWLPLHSSLGKFSLKQDLESSRSIFRYFQKVIALRNATPALRQGWFYDLTGSRKDCFIYERRYEGEIYWIAVNYDKESKIEAPKGYTKVLGNIEGEREVFLPFEAVIYKKDE